MTRLSPCYLRALLRIAAPTGLAEFRAGDIMGPTAAALDPRQPLLPKEPHQPDDLGAGVAAQATHIGVGQSAALREKK